MPGVPKQQPATSAAIVVLSGPNRVLIIFRQPHQQHPVPPNLIAPKPLKTQELAPRKTRERLCTKTAGRCRLKLASVSACEHPTTQTGDAGYCPVFTG